MEQLLGGLLGSQQDHEQAQDFVKRYEQGPPTSGFTGQEAQQQYQKIAGKIPPDLYKKAAQEAFARLSPQERQQIVQHVKQQGQKQGNKHAQNWQDNETDPSQMAERMTQMQQNSPDMVNQLVSSVAGDNPLMKAALGGIAAMAMKQMMGH
jgi:hypothetical protein